ncbi:MAG: peptidase domain protein [Myxococcales bacterium]|nr:peptidase domain protein [Myxococcales bacterium]
MKRALVMALSLAALPALAAKPDLTKQPELTPLASWKAPVPTSSMTAAGTRVAVLTEHSLPIVHVLMTVPAGSAWDPVDRPGLAAAVAMMLQDGGAGKRTAPEVAQAFADLGIEVEEHVDSDEVQLELTVLARNLDRALTLLGDLVARPRFEATEWTRARARRLDEIRRRMDEPRHIVEDVFDRVLYGDHPYGHSFLGTLPSINAMTVEELRSFYAAHYGPRAVAIALVGDVEQAAATQAVARALDGWKSTAQPPAPLPAPKVTPARVVIVDRPGAPQSQIRVGHLGRERRSPDFAVMSLLETVLGGSFTSRLNQNLREKHGYTYGARANFDLHQVAGPFWCGAGVRTDATGPALKETILELQGMLAPMPPEELGKGRSLVLQSVVESFADGNRAASYIADLLAFGLPLDYWSRLPAQLAALDVPSVTKAAGKLLTPNNLTIVVVGDRKAIEPEMRLLPFVKSIEFRDVEGKLLK